MNMKPINAYITGYALSVLLTLVSFGLMYWHLRSEHEFPPHELIVPIFVLLAVSQFFVQMIFFLHLGQEKGVKWNTLAFGLTLFIVAIVVGGSLWIMNSLQHDYSTKKEIYPGGVISPQSQRD